LRQRLVDAVERGEGSLRELADLFQVSLSFVVRLLRRYRDTGSGGPHTHPPVAAVERGEGSLRELADLFQVSLSFVVRLLRRYRDTGSVAPKPHAGGPTP